MTTDPPVHHLGHRGWLTIYHCDQPMTWKDTTTNWVGKPGDPGGYQHDIKRWRCLNCGAVATIAQKEPDRSEQAV